MRKIYITITNGRAADIIKELQLSNINLEEVEIVERKRGTVFQYRLKHAWYKFRTSFKFYFQRIKELIRYRRLEPLLGGGSYGLESFYGHIFDLFTGLIIPGVQYDLIKLIIIKSYKYLKTKETDYIVIASQVRAPFDCIVKIFIPNNLTDEILDRVLDQGNDLFTNLDKIRHYLGAREISIKCLGDYQWNVKIKDR